MLCRPLQCLTCGLPASAAVACTGVSILLSYASTSITVWSPCRVGIYRNCSAGAPVREPAKRNGPATSLNDQPEVNGEGPARNKARGIRRTPVDRKRPDTTREDPTGNQARVTGRTPIERKLF